MNIVGNSINSRAEPVCIGRSRTFARGICHEQRTVPELYHEARLCLDEALPYISLVFRRPQAKKVEDFRKPCFSLSLLRPSLLAALLFFSACGGSKGKRATDGSYKASAEAAYLDALEEMRDGNCTEAEPAFREVKKKYPYSRFAALAEIRSGDCLIEQKEYVEAVQVYQRFIRTHPSHKLVPYARFKVGDAHFRQVPDGWFLAPPDHERDQGPTRSALRALRSYMRDFPNDSHVPEAKEMAAKCVEMLAKLELYVAEYYIDEDKPRGAIMRLETLLRNYPDAKVANKALQLLASTYKSLGEDKMARKAYQEFSKNSSAKRVPGGRAPGGRPPVTP